MFLPTKHFSSTQKGKVPLEYSLCHCWFSRSCHTLMISICCSWKTLETSSLSSGIFVKRGHLCCYWAWWTLLCAIAVPPLIFMWRGWKVVESIRDLGPVVEKVGASKNELKLVKSHSFPAHFNWPLVRYGGKELEMQFSNCEETQNPKPPSWKWIFSRIMQSLCFWPVRLEEMLF